MSELLPVAKASSSISLALDEPKELAERANREHALVQQAIGSAVEHAIRAGEALLAAKEQLAHGAWLPWLEKNFNGHRNTASGYMRLASNEQRVVHLEEPSIRKALASLTKSSITTVETEEELATLPEGVFRTVVADPPWQYANKATRGAAEDHYSTMTLDELCALDIEQRAADESHLYLWTTNGFLREAFDVLAAWGFDYKTTLVWVKPQIGMGNYFRSSTEYVLFGIRGGLRTRDCNQRNWFEAPRRKHSAKPESFFDLVEKVSPGPYLELFARRRRMGWDVWGDEA